MIIFINIPIPNIRLLITIQAVKSCPIMPSNEGLNGKMFPYIMINHSGVKIAPSIMKLSTLHFAIIRSIPYFVLNRSFSPCPDSKQGELCTKKVTEPVIIIKVSINSSSRKDSLAKAVYQLHHENQLGLKYISGILKINEIDISVNNLMIYSQTHFEKTPLPVWARNIVNNTSLKKDWGKFRIMTDEERIKHNRSVSRYSKTPEARQKRKEYARQKYYSMTPEQRRAYWQSHTKPQTREYKDKLNAKLRLMTRIRRCYIVDLLELAIKTEDAYKIRVGWSS